MFGVSNNLWVTFWWRNIFSYVNGINNDNIIRYEYTLSKVHSAWAWDKAKTQVGIYLWSFFNHVYKAVKTITYKLKVRLFLFLPWSHKLIWQTVLPSKSFHKKTLVVFHIAEDIIHIAAMTSFSSLQKYEESK